MERIVNAAYFVYTGNPTMKGSNIMDAAMYICAIYQVRCLLNQHTIMHATEWIVNLW
jgi:hypothetical protein